MNSLIIVVLCALAAAQALPQAKYTNKYDNVDLDEILQNKRLLIPYIKCCLDQGKCSPDAKELKSHIQEALENNCGKCTDVQRQGTRKVIAHLINHEPEYWAQLTEKYDNQQKYTSKYEKELKTLKTN